VGNRDRGKPRSLFSLSNDYAYLISVTNDFTSKKLLPLTDYHKTILKIWSIQNNTIHPHIAELYRAVLPSISEFDCVFLTETEDDVKMDFVYSSREAAKLVAHLQSERRFKNDGFEISLFKKESFRPDSLPAKSRVIALHDPSGLLKKKEAGIVG
jgi:hypothetical protein